MHVIVLSQTISYGLSGNPGVKSTWGDRRLVVAVKKKIS